MIPLLGTYELRRVTTGVGQRFATALADRGAGPSTIKKTLAMLQGIFERAVESGFVTVNPIRAVKRPQAPRARTIRPLPPMAVEELRTALPTLEDRTVVSVIAYAGLRPGEALALTWSDVGETIRVDKAVALGAEKDTKTGRHRNVRLLRPLAQDLAEWRLACGRPPDTALVFPGNGASPWTHSMYRNWRRRVFRPAAARLGLAMRPYDLRHSFASLLFAEGLNPAEITEEMGHSLQTLLSTYVHVIEELRGTERQDAEALIREARESVHTQVTQKHAILSRATQETPC